VPAQFGTAELAIALLAFSSIFVNYFIGGKNDVGLFSGLICNFSIVSRKKKTSILNINTSPRIGVSVQYVVSLFVALQGYNETPVFSNNNNLLKTQ
jgi:hypothetical protein